MGTRQLAMTEHLESYVLGHSRESAVAHIEAARVGAERRQHVIRVGAPLRAGPLPERGQ